jgi:hypothetical protein
LNEAFYAAQLYCEHVCAKSLAQNDDNHRML